MTQAQTYLSDCWLEKDAFNASRSVHFSSCTEIKINVNFYFHTS